jgi:hypothetical protein
VCALKFTFIPATPARSAPGSSRIDASARTFMISFVQCSVRTIRTSNEVEIPSLTSRADASAASTLAVSATNRSADPSVKSGSNSEWLSVVNTSRWGASVLRSRPTRRRASLSTVSSSSGSSLGCPSAFTTNSSASLKQTRAWWPPTQRWPGADGSGSTMRVSGWLWAPHGRHYGAPGRGSRKSRG